MGFNVAQIINKELPIQLLDSDYRIGDLVKVPFRSGHFYSTDVGSTASFQSSGITSNEDGSNTGLNVSVPVGSQNGVSIRVPFYGRSFGLRWRRDSNAGDFSIAIDGVSYGLITGQHTYLINESAVLTDGESLVLITDDLPDGVHYAEIMVSNRATTNAILFYGLLLERRAGYSEKPRTKPFLNPIAVTTSDVVIPKGSNPDSLLTVEKIIYTNTTASAITVTVNYNGVQMWQKPIPANDSVEFVLGSTINSLTTHLASATGVNATVIGGY